MPNLTKIFEEYNPWLSKAPVFSDNDKIMNCLAEAHNSSLVMPDI